MRSGARAALVAVVLVLVTSVAGCSLFEQEEPEPVTTEIPWQASDGSEPVCGMNPVDVATAIGLPVGRVDGRLSGQGASLEGTCDIWPEDETVVGGAMLTVKVFPLSSDEGESWRSELAGEVAAVREPDVRYDDIEGGMWRTDLGGDGGSQTRGGVSAVVQGERVIVLTSRRSVQERDTAADLLALTQQVASSHGLATADA